MTHNQPETLRKHLLQHFLKLLFRCAGQNLRVHRKHLAVNPGQA
jgi:hypothetical protein